MIRLYDYELSGNCYKIRLFAAFLGLRLERVPIDYYPGVEHKSAWFLAINPLGELPVIDDEGLVLRDAQAILVYLGSRYDPTDQWYDRKSPARMGYIGQWLAFADQLTATASRARLHDNMFLPADIEACRRGAHFLLKHLDEHLWFSEQEGWNWICAGGHPSIADVACFPYVMLCEEGGISRLPYPAVRRWTDRVKQLAGFTPMPGIFPGPPSVLSIAAKSTT